MFKCFSCVFCTLLILITGCTDNHLPREYKEFSKYPETAPEICAKPHGLCDREAQNHNADVDPADLERAPGPVSDIELTSHIQSIWSEQAPVWHEAAAVSMSMATFKPPAQESAAQVTFTLLAGDGGGVQGNVTRWFRQLNHINIAPADMSRFIAELKPSVSSGGNKYTPVDFTDFGTHEYERSMLAAIIPLEGKTLFIKLSGPLSELKNLKETFWHKTAATAEIKRHDESV